MKYDKKRLKKILIKYYIITLLLIIGGIIIYFVQASSIEKEYKNLNIYSSNLENATIDNKCISTVSLQSHPKGHGQKYIVFGIDGDSLEYGFFNRSTLKINELFLSSDTRISKDKNVYKFVISYQGHNKEIHFENINELIEDEKMASIYGSFWVLIVLLLNLIIEYYSNISVKRKKRKK